MPRSPTPIALSGEERQPLQAWQRAGSTEQRMVARAQILLRAAGGEGTEAKVIAATEAGVTIILIRRPPFEPGPLAETVDEAFAWVEDHV